MRTYGQYCSLAKALDVVGDRWTLLIVRELMLQGSARYTDLREGLPGIATNLLAERLRQLEADGLVTREEAPPPVATTLFSLTERGRELDAVLDALGRWGMPLMEQGPAGGDVFCSRWLAWPAELMLRDGQTDGPPVSVELRTGDTPMVVEAGGGGDGIRVRPLTREDRPDLVLSGTAHSILGLLSGKLDLAEARGLGLKAEGSLKVLARLRAGDGDGAAVVGSG